VSTATNMGEFTISEISIHSNQSARSSSDEDRRAPRDLSLAIRNNFGSGDVGFAGSNYDSSIASGCDDDDMVSDISNISTHHVDTAAPRYRCSNRVFFPVLAATIAMLVIVIVSSTSGSNEASRSATSYRSPGQLQMAPRTSLDDGGGDGMTVEFTVANLNTNAQNCTHIKGTHSLQCVPYHNNATNHFRVRVHPDWAPKGVQRFKELTDAEFWTDVRIFRVVPQFVSQFGLSSYPERQKEWTSIEDDPDVGISNTRGMVSFASSGANSRTTQLFINTGDNQYLDKMGFTPIGRVMPAGETWGSMDVVDEIYSGYREDPNQMRIRQDGLMYLEDNFPKLSYFVKADFVSDESTGEASAESVEATDSEIIVPESSGSITPADPIDTPEPESPDQPKAAEASGASHLRACLFGFTVLVCLMMHEFSRSGAFI